MHAGRLCTRLLGASRAAAARCGVPCRSAAVWPTALTTQKTDERQVSSKIFKPVQVVPMKSDQDIGAELVGKLKKSSIVNVLNKFQERPVIVSLCEENGLDTYLQQQAFAAFRRFCVEADILPATLHCALHEVITGRSVDNLFPHFMAHTRDVFPHLNCMPELKLISDMREPANWYPNARAIKRKIIFHAGPTNSGKTYHAMKRFREAASGVYCGPLKLLAVEVHSTVNEKGTLCDLVTGEDRKYAIDEKTPASHVSCTVEMASVDKPYEVAVIDEIQQIRDSQRGWAWTRAFLGLAAKEIHVCGEAGALNLLETLCLSTGEEIEVHHYERLTELSVENKALESLDNVQPGDCIVCFKKSQIYEVSRNIEASGKEVAVIYGSLPPNTKLAQAEKFNDPEHSCKVMVATDAIGMGLNLSIRRIIFYSLVKPTDPSVAANKDDTKSAMISVSSALQIAGRAGRYRTQWEHGYVTTYRPEDLEKLRELLSQTPEPITQAGLHPTADKIEMYAHHLPKNTFTNLIDIFVNLCTVDHSNYFMCNLEGFKYLAGLIEHIQLPLKARYVFCCAPINIKLPIVISMFQQMARLFSSGQPITFALIYKNFGWPLKEPQTIAELVHHEMIFDVLDLYLWLSYRFVDEFPETEAVRIAQAKLDQSIQEGIYQITRLIKNSEVKTSAVEAARATATNLSCGDKTPMPGRLTSRLLAQGLLTPDMLRQLQKEWNKSQGDVETKRSKKKSRRPTRSESPTSTCS